MTPDKIPYQYYTHLVYGFAPPINTTTWEVGAIPGYLQQRWKTFNNLKKVWNGKTLLSLGGDLPVRFQ